MKQVWEFVSRLRRKALAGWAPYLEETVAAQELSLVMVRASIPSVGFFFMLGLASVIATFGVITNSAPTIIGAMIIAR